MNRHALRLLALLPSAALLIAGCGTEPEFFRAIPGAASDTSDDEVGAESDAGPDESSDDASSDSSTDVIAVPDTGGTPVPDAHGDDAFGTPDMSADAGSSDPGPADAGVADAEVSDHEAPVARLACRIEGSLAIGHELGMRVQPLETVICSAAGSDDAQGGILNYQWSMVEMPIDTNPVLRPQDGVETALFLPQTGRYTLQVVVTDDRGTTSAPVQLTIVAVPFDDLHVQVTWHTPDGDVLADPGADLDLHLLHQNGCWKDAHWDCHYNNTHPNWGDPYSTNDDPSIDIDGMSGIENVMLDNPETGVRYTVGVHYYDDHDMGDAYATVQVFMFGELVYEVTDRLMQSLGARDGQWWEVASIDWPSATVTAIDSITSAPPECEVPAP